MDRESKLAESTFLGSVMTAVASGTWVLAEISMGRRPEQTLQIMASNPVEFFQRGAELFTRDFLPVAITPENLITTLAVTAVAGVSLKVAYLMDQRRLRAIQELDSLPKS